MDASVVDPGLAVQQRVAEAQAERMIGLGVETAEILKRTLRNATRSYRAITAMCVAMFAAGLTLFVVSSIYGTFFADKKAAPLLFSGLGAGVFVAVFMTGSIGKTQSALSNLVQVEIAFMNFFEQITLWDTYATLPADGFPPRPDPARFEQSSAMLQQRSAETIELLEKFTETTQAT